MFCNKYYYVLQRGKGHVWSGVCGFGNIGRGWESSSSRVYWSGKWEALKYRNGNGKGLCVWAKVILLNKHFWSIYWKKKFGKSHTFFWSVVTRIFFFNESLQKPQVVFQGEKKSTCLHAAGSGNHQDGEEREGETHYDFPNWAQRLLCLREQTNHAA